MKKFTMLFVAICFLAFALTGCSSNDTFTEKSYTSGENSIEKVVVQVTNRQLEISASEDEQIQIDYFDGEKEYLNIIAEDKVLTIKLEFNKDWNDFIGTKASKEYRKIQIKLPNNLLTTISATTSNENIVISTLSFKEQMDLVTNGGDIVCENINVGKAINLATKNGNITGSIIGGWDDFSISCTIKKGNCNLPTLKENGEKSFTANCNNGDINIEFIK